MKTPTGFNKKSIALVSSIVFVALSVSVSVAFASLTFNGNSINGDSNSSVDATGTVTIGASSAAGITIGRSGITATFPGTVTITGTTTTLQNLVVSGNCSGCGVGNFTAGGDLSGSSTSQTVNEKLTVFDALNAKNSSNTVTASFGPGAGYATLNIYEYRGASTSSSFDASSTQLQPDTQTPSSGSANATSAVELLFGVTYNGNTSEIPSAGTGFTLESSSTASVGNVYVEDSTQYVTGPVAATWQYSATTPSSTALIVTFK